MTNKTGDYFTGKRTGHYQAANQIKTIINHWKRSAKRLHDKGERPDTIDRNQYLYDILTMIESEIDVIILADPND